VLINPEDLCFGKLGITWHNSETRPAKHTLKTVDNTGTDSM